MIAFILAGTVRVPGLAAVKGLTTAWQSVEDLAHTLHKHRGILEQLERCVPQRGRT